MMYASRKKATRCNERSPCLVPYRRVFFKWKEPVLLCDYWQPSEDAGEAVERCEEILGDTFAKAAEKGEQFVFLEDEADTSTVGSTKWDPKQSNLSMRTRESHSVGAKVVDGKASSQSANPFLGIVALTMIIIALLVGLLSR